MPNCDPCQIITPLVLVGLGLGVGEGLGLGVGLGLGNHIVISTRGVIIWQGVENGHTTGCSRFTASKGRYSEESLLPGCFGAPLTSIVGKKYYGSQWCPKTAWLKTFFKISSFVFGRTKKFIQVWNYLRMSK